VSPTFSGNCACEECFEVDADGCEYDALQDSDLCQDCTDGAHL
jgi:hypothetical protein